MGHEAKRVDGREDKGMARRSPYSRRSVQRVDFVLVFVYIHTTAALGPQGAWEDQWSTRWNPNGTQCLTLLTPVHCFCSLRSSRVFRRHDQSNWEHNLWPRCLI